ncbi:MAG: hypothetical protein ACRDGQ_08080 [Candidatus Limnocylindrales bacterium]
MSKHHQSHRRRSYGRRQHEIHERPLEAHDQSAPDGADAGRIEHAPAPARFEFQTAPARLVFSVGD